VHSIQLLDFSITWMNYQQIVLLSNAPLKTLKYYNERAIEVLLLSKERAIESIELLQGTSHRNTTTIERAIEDIEILQGTNPLKYYYYQRNEPLKY
jgi:hypothetical protein